MSTNLFGNDSSAEQAFPLRLAARNPILGSHRIAGVCVLPGLAYPDIYYSALTRLGLLPNEWCLSQIAILRPLELPDDVELQAEVSFAGFGSDEMLAQVRAGGQIFCRCRVIRRRGVAPVDSEDDQLAVKARSARVYHIDACYSRCADYQLVHSGAMRIDGQIFVDGDGILLSLRLTDEQRALAAKTLLFPAALDAAAIACAQELGIGGPDAPGLFLPLAVEKIEFFCRLPEEYLVRVSLDARGNQDDLKKIPSIRVYSRTGRLCCEVTGLTAKLVRQLHAQNSELGALRKLARTAQGTVSEVLLDALSRLLSVSREQIDRHAGFFELGLSSEQLVEIVSVLERVAGRELSPTLLFEHKTLANLLPYLEGLAATPPATAAQPASFAQPAMAAPLTTAAPHAGNVRPTSAHVKSSRADLMSVAIVGMDGAFPEAETISEFRDNLRAGRDCVREVPRERWDVQQHPGIYCKRGGFIERVADFDAALFNISPREASQLDPNERLFLQSSYRALSNAGYNPVELAEREVGVFVGVMNSDYGMLECASDDRRPLTYLSTIANRVSYAFDFNGPSYSYDTACSSSLVAIYEAMQSLRSGRCKVAIAGGVNLSLHPHKYYGLCKWKMLSPSGACRSFGAEADGYVPGEGVGAVVLKPLQDAVRDGDHIHAVLKGGAVNHGGRSSGFTVPNPGAQTALINAGLADAGVGPEDVDFWEAHGTGTLLGDPIEIHGLESVFRGTSAADEEKLPISSVKSNIGHLEAAAGVAALIKCVLQLQHRELYPSIHAERLNPSINPSVLPLKVQTRYSRLTKRSGRSDFELLGGVSSFGAGGTNCQLVIAEAPVVAPSASEPQGPLLALYSANDLKLLQKYILEQRAFLTDANGPVGDDRGTDYCLTLIEGRPEFSKRLLVVGSSMAELRDELGRVPEELDETELASWNDAQLQRLDLLDQDGQLKACCRQPGWGVRELRAHFAAKRFRRVPVPGPPLALRRFWLPGAGQGPASVEHVLPQSPTPSPRETSSKAGLKAELFVERDVLLAPLTSSLPRRSHAVTRTKGAFGSSSPSFQMTETTLARPALSAIAEAILSAAKCGERALVDADLFSGGDEAASDSPYLDIFEFFRLMSSHEGRLEVWLIAREHDLLRTRNAFLRSLSHSLRVSNPALDFRYVEIADAQALSYFKDGAVLPDSFRGIFRVRDRNLHGRRLVPLELRSSLSEASDLAGKRALVLGGMGGLGRVAARYLAEKHGMNVLLTGRAPLDATKLAFLRELEGFGVHAGYDQLDLCDDRAIERWAANVQAHIDAVLHCAGSTGQQPLRAKSAREFYDVLRPKWQGVQRLNLALREHRLDFYAYFSSVSTLYGDFGHGDYALGNELLNQIVSSREGVPEAWRDTSVFAINWPLWSTAGIALSEPQQRAFERLSGVTSISEAHGVALLDTLVGARSQLRGTVVYALPGDAERILRNLADPRSEETANSGPRAGSTRSAREDVIALVKNGIAEILGHDPEDVSFSKKFHDYGFDSIRYAEFAEYLSNRLRLPVSASTFFEYPTAEQLANHLAGTRPRNPVSLVAEETPLLGSSMQKVTEASSSPAASTTKSDAVAIVGVDFILPGAKTFDELYRVFGDRVCTLSSITEHAERVMCMSADLELKAHFIDGVDRFEAEAFGIPGAEAEFMDPQQRLLLQSTYRALDDAGYPPSRLSGLEVGVYVSSQFQEYQTALGDATHPTLAIGNARAMLANRISYQFDLKGPSEVFDAACSGSFVALERAVRDLRAGRVGAAVVAATNLVLSDAAIRAGLALGAISPSNQARPFQKGADGFTKGEGVVVLVLRSVAQAELAGDRVYAAIRGVHQHHGGSNATLVAPNRSAQVHCLRRALADASLTPADIDYIEGQGTGGEIGDPLEFGAYCEVFATQEEKRLPVGSLKADLGHLEAASGLAALVKVLLSLRRNALFGIRDFASVNAALESEVHSVYPLSGSRSWFGRRDAQGTSLPRRALIHNFGFGGVNVDVIVEEYLEKRTAVARSGCYVLPLSAHNVRSLSLQATALSAHVDATFATTTAAELTNLVERYQLAKDPKPTRAALVFDDIWGLRRQLKRLTDALTRVSGQSLLSCSEPMVDEFIADGETALQTAHRWLSGESPVWTTDASSGVRLQLGPKFCFAPDVCWVPQSATQRVKVQNAPNSAFQNVSTVEGLACSRLTKATEQWVVSHQISGTRVIPGAFQLEFALQAATMLAGASLPIEVRDIRWDIPIVMGSDQMLYAILEASADGIHRVTIQGGRGASAVPYGRMSVVLGARPPELQPSSQGICNAQAVDRDAFYRGLSRAGFEYGSEYRLVRQLELKSDSMRAQVSGKHALDGTFLGPNLFDAALHSCFALIQTDCASRFFMPASVGSLRLLEPLPSSVIVHARRRAPTGTGDLVFDLEIDSSTGQRLALVESFCLREGPTDFVPYNQVFGSTSVVATGDSRAMLRSYLTSVLGSEAIDLDHSFARLGMHSVYMAGLVQFVRSHFQVAVSMRELVSMETPAGLIELLEAGGAKPAPALSSPGEARLERLHTRNRLLDFLE